jgi:two-component system sensor histidine kinase SenX3
VTWPAGVALVLAVAAGVLLGLALGRLLGRAGAAPPAPPGPAPAPPPEAGASWLSDVLHVLRGGAVVLGPADEVVLANPAARALGLVRDRRLAVPDLVRLARDCRADGEQRVVEIDLPGRGRVAEATAVRARIARAADGKHVTLLAEDVSEARRVDAVRRDFVANVSHELKTPVGAMSLLAEALLDAADEPEAVRRFAGRVQHESARLTRLVQELIDLSRLQGAEPLRAAEPVRVDAVVAEALDRNRLLATARQVDLVAGGEPGLVVRGSEPQLVTALSNLLANAVAYSHEGSRVAVGVRRGDEVVEISVTDRGIGIPEDDLDRVFERFYRSDPARSRETGGSGLGLAIVKHVASNHGGSVSVWSVEGEGSTFTLRLPALEPGKGSRPSRPAVDLEEMPVTPGASATRPGSPASPPPARTGSPAAARTEGTR